MKLISLDKGDLPLDALRILELDAPITPEGVDRAGHAAMHRLSDAVGRSPADADLAARAQAYAGEVRAAHAFLRERPENLYPYRMVTPPAEQQMPPAPGASMPLLAVPAPVPVASPTEAAAPVWENATPACSTPPPLPKYAVPIAHSPAQSSQRFPGWLSIILWPVLILACGVSMWYGAQRFYSLIGPALGKGGSPGLKPSEAATLRGVAPSDDPPGTASDDGSPRRLVMKTAPDGSIVATMPSGSVIRSRPGGNRSGTYGPEGSPFKGNAPAGGNRSADEKRDAEAQYLRAKTLLFPPSPPADAPEGLRLLEKAASQDHLMAGYMLACTYLDGIGRPADPKKGVSLLRSLTENRTFPAAALRLADCHRDGLGVLCDYKYALSVYLYWETLPSAQYRISLLYQHGCGVPKDDAEALKWLQIAVAASHSPALYQMGLRYAKGQGVPQDDVKAAEAYELAAKLEYAPAQAALGRCYQSGRGVPFTSGLAIHFFQLAAVQGFPHAQDYLGSC